MLHACSLVSTCTVQTIHEPPKCYHLTHTSYDLTSFAQYSSPPPPPTDRACSN